ncbi:MAG: MFS transporter [Verrucomicrobiota bacterium]
MPVDNAAATYRNDLRRSPFQGVLEAGWQAFPLLIAIRYFDAPESAKAFIAGAGPIGFLLTPLTLYIAATLRARPNIACAFVFSVAALMVAGATIAQSLLLFSICIIGSQVASVQHGPLMVQVYTANYAAHERGRRISTPLMITAFASVIFAWLGGELLDLEISYYRYLFLCMIVASAASAWAISKTPSLPLSTTNIGNPWQNFSLIWKDRFFGYILGCWMLLGLGNLIALPIRIEYLTDPDYGINANNTTVASLMVVIPAIAKLLSTKIWGHFFDKLHFITTRNLLNICFLLSIALFFFTTNLVLLSIAMVFQGIAMGGGRIFWGLWVTKIAPDEKTSSYMSIHMALTGLRGTLAPFIGYWILTQSAPTTVAYVGIGLIAVAMVLFEFVRKHHRLIPSTSSHSA